MNFRRGLIDSKFIIEKINRFSYHIKRHTVIVLDNAKVHQFKPFKAMKEVWAKRNLFIFYLPPYSPNFNLAEYLIHLLRLRVLHHLPIGTTIEQIRMRIKSFFENQQLQTSIQIENTIQHIYNLIL